MSYGSSRQAVTDKAEEFKQELTRRIIECKWSPHLATEFAEVLYELFLRDQAEGHLPKRGEHQS